MRKVLHNEIAKERCNAKALGAYTASLKGGGGGGDADQKLELNGRVFNPLDYTVSFGDNDLASHSNLYGVGALGHHHWINTDREFDSVKEAVGNIKTGYGWHKSVPVEISFKGDFKGNFAKDSDGILYGTERVVANPKTGKYVIQELRPEGYELFSERRDKYFDSNIDVYNNRLKRK